MGIEFRKYEGLGNDFVLVHEEALGDVTVDAERARAWCDRHFGVGADGVLLVSPSERADVKMRIFNADGSESEMCGNGIRAVVADLGRRDGYRVPSYRVETLAGILTCGIVGLPSRVDPEIEVDMGLVAFDPVDGPVRRALRVGGREIEVVEASVGNPHAVMMVDKADDLQRLAAELGPLVSTHPTFPSGANIGFVRVGAEALELVVYERGVGLTLACGTGACAATAVAAALELVDASAAVTVSLPGGDLRIQIAPSEDSTHSGRVLMTGPARLVFEGTLVDEGRRPVGRR